jgi:hypothetical protein
MAFQESTYSGDDTYTINCTGDVCSGDEIAFERARFTGSYRRPQFDGFELICGRVERESYGAQRQQHTFTLRLPDGSTTLIKGRNLYKNGVWRKPWPDESARVASLHEKHARGRVARAQKERRMLESSNVI